MRTVKVYLKELELLGYSKVKVAKDRGFYSVEPINTLYKENIKFVTGGKTNISFVKDTIREEKDKMRKMGLRR